MKRMLVEPESWLDQHGRCRWPPAAPYLRRLLRGGPTSDLRASHRTSLLLSMHHIWCILEIDGAMIFEMNLPEGAPKERLRLQFAKAVPAFDDLDLLGIVGASQIGRLRYLQQPQLGEVMPSQKLDEILTYQGSVDLFVHLLERFATHSSISGVQPKVLVRDAKAAERMTYRGATHIVKTFDEAGYPELSALTQSGSPIERS